MEHQKTFTNTVSINSGEYLFIELHYPNDFESSCDNMFLNMEDIIEIKFQKFSGCKSAKTMFSQCHSLKNLNLSSFDASNITNMFDMISYCTSLKNLNLSSFNTSKVKNMRGMFYKCTSLENLDLSSFNTNEVTNMYCMFAFCYSLKY